MIKLKKALVVGLSSLLFLGTLFTKPDISVKTTDLTAYARQKSHFLICRLITGMRRLDME